MIINNLLIFTKPCVNPQKPEMELSLPPPLKDQAQNHLIFPALSPGLSPQGSSSPHHWQSVDGNAKRKGKQTQKQTQKPFHYLSSFPSIQCPDIIIFPNMCKLKSEAHSL